MPKITALPAAGALTGAELLAGVQGGVTSQMDLDGVWATPLAATAVVAAEVAALSGISAPEWTVITDADDIDFNAGMQALELGANWAPDFLNVPLDPTPGQVTLFVNVTGTQVITWPPGTIWMTAAPTPTDGEWFLVEFATRTGRTLAWNLGSGTEPPPFPESPTPLWNAFGWYLNYEAALIEGVADGATVEQWREPKRGWHLDMPVGANRPTFRAAYANLNGRAAVEGDGTTSYIRRYGLTLAQPYSLAAIISTDQADAVALVVGTGVTSDARGLGQTNVGSGRWSMFASNTNSIGGQPTISTPHLLEAYNDGTSSYLKIDGVLISNATDPGNAALDQITMFAGYDGTLAGFFDGAVASLGVYEGDHGTDPGWAAARAEIVTYFGIDYAAQPGTATPSANIPWTGDYNADSSGVADGATVEPFWRDDSGNGRALWQDDPTQRPTLVAASAPLNNQPAFDFTGGQVFMRRLSSLLSDPWSVLFVVVPDNVDSTQRIIGTNEASSGRGVGFITTTTGAFSASLGGSGALTAPSTISNGTAYLVEFFSNGASSQMWVNGTSVAGPASAGSSPTPNFLSLGAGVTTSSPGAQYDGRLACAKFLVGSNHRLHANYAAEIAALKSKYGFVY